MKKNIVQILGPTGTGKTRITIDLCKRIRGEVISADSVQVYKGFDIGSDKIGKDEMEGVPHFMIDVFDPAEQFNASIFLEHSYKIADDIVARGGVPVVCGGTALYHRVMIKGLFQDKGAVRIRREKLEALADSLGVERLWNRVREFDPEYAETIKVTDRKRILRALEIYYNNGIIPSRLSEHNVTPYSGWNFIRIGLERERQQLYRRIEKRVDQMVHKGLFEEVAALLKIYPESVPPFQAIGYREVVQYLNGELSYDRSVELIKQHTRNFAKRQLSWYRQEEDIIWFNPDKPDEIVDIVSEIIAGK